MEVAESRDHGSVGPPTGADTSGANGQPSFLFDMDDRSSSLSVLSEVSDNDLSDYDEEPLKSDKNALENDSEAETERVEDSPNNARLRNDIVVSASGYGPSPSKLAQSTTYDDVEDDEEPTVDDSPSKPGPKRNGIAEQAEDTPGPDDTPSESISKKRKRLGSVDETGSDLEDKEPLKKRRGSVKSELSELSGPPADETLISPEPTEEVPKDQDSMPTEDIPESDAPAVQTKAKKVKKGKRKSRRGKDMDEPEAGTAELGGVDDNAAEEEDAIEREEEADDAETAAKHEEECECIRFHDIISWLTSQQQRRSRLHCNP